MSRYGDPSFAYHIAITKVWALLAARLVEEPVIQFNATNYAVGLARYLSSVHALAAVTSSANVTATVAALVGLERAIQHLQLVATRFDARATHLAALAAEPNAPDMPAPARAQLFAEVRAVNVRYKYLERAFLYPKGLDTRPWFKHVVFAPGLWTGYAGATFPGLVESVQFGDDEGLKRWASIIEGTVWRAVRRLDA